MWEVFEEVAPVMAMLLDAELGDVVSVADIEGAGAVLNPVGETGFTDGEGLEALGLAEVDPAFVE